MKNLLFLLIPFLPFHLAAQGPNTNINPVQVQGKNTNNYFRINQIDNDADQQANPPQQQSQGQGPNFGSDNSGSTPCADCDKVKKAIKLSHTSIRNDSPKKTQGYKKRIKKFSGRMNFKMKKVFAHKYKPKPSYAICFIWH